MSNWLFLTSASKVRTLPITRIIPFPLLIIREETEQRKDLRSYRRQLSEKIINKYLSVAPSIDEFERTITKISRPAGVSE